MAGTDRRVEYIELGGKMDSIDTRMLKVEKDIVDIKAIVNNNLVGERSVWQAIEKLTKALDESNARQTEALNKAVEDTNRAIEESIKDRKELRNLVIEQSTNMRLLTSSYSSITSWLKSIVIVIITSTAGILVGILTHTIHIP